MAVTAVAALSAFFATRTAALDAVEAFTQDVRVANLSAPLKSAEDIVVVAITEDTLAQFPYRSPINRAFLAELIDAIAAQQPQAIGLDILFDRPSEARADAALKDTFARHGDLILLAGPPRNGADLSPEHRMFWLNYTADVSQADGTLILSQRDRTVRTQIPADAQHAPQSFSAALAARAGAALPRGEVVIPFRTSAATDAPWPFPTYAAEHVLNVPPSLGWFTGKTVLIGGILELEDRFATPMRLGPDADDTTPGVIVHAYQLAQLRDGVAPRTTPLLATLIITLAIAGVAVLAGLSILDWRLLTLVLTGVFVGYALIVLISFSGLGMLAPALAPSLAIPFGGAGGAALSARLHAKGRRALDQAFRHYLAPEVVDEIMRRPDRYRIDGDVCSVSILVTDIEGFTAMLSREDARAISPVINRYFDDVIDAVIAHGGAVDKIVGDGLFAMFGAPVRMPNHAARAVACALALDEIGERFRLSHAAIGFGRTRIGVSSGEAVVGSFGGARRINYTAYGAIVNLAARLQDANKKIGTRVLISEAAAQEVVARPVGRLLLRGVGAAELTFEPCANAARVAEYETAYRALETGEGAALFSALADADPHDALVAFHAARLRDGKTGIEIDLR